MIPSLTALRAFEAAARHLSFKLAAEELNLTPTAVSHQIRGLEAALAHKLFDRRVRQVDLTAEGAELARALGPAFLVIDKAVRDLKAKDRRRIVTLGTAPIIASRWLAPKLGTFWCAHPDIDLRLHHSPVPIHRQMANYDIAIAWGEGPWPGWEAELLLRVEATPVVAPTAGFLDGPLDEPRQLLAMPLLHYRGKKDWAQWFAEAGVDLPAEIPGALFDDANVLLQAALEGQGVALGILPFADDELSLGRLSRPWNLTVRPSAAYYLLQSRASRDRDAARAVVAWLLSLKEPAGADQDCILSP